MTPAATALVLMALAVASKLLGLGREAALAGFFGASEQTDAYVLAATLPNVLFAALGVALGAAFIPVFARREEAAGRAAAFRTVNALISVLSVGLMLVIAITEALAPSIVRAVAPGFTRETFATAVTLSRWTIPSLLFLLLASVLTGLLQARLKFLLAAVAGLASSVVMVAGVLAAGVFGTIELAAVGALLGTMILLLAQLPGLTSLSYAPRWDLNWKDPGLREMGRLALPVLAATGIGQVSLIVGRILASYLATGSMAALNYAAQLQLLPVQVLALAISTVVFPLFSSSAARGDLSSFGDLFAQSLRWTLFALVPCAVIVTVLRESIVRLFYARGAFDERAVEMTTFALLLYGPGVVSVAVRDLCNRAVFALARPVVSLYGTVLEVAVTVALSIALVRAIDHGGIALAASLGPVAGSTVLLHFVSKRTPSVNRDSLVHALKLLSAGLAMALTLSAALMVERAASNPAAIHTAGRAAWLVFELVTGTAVFGLACHALRVDEVTRVGRATRSLLRAYTTGWYRSAGVLRVGRFRLDRYGNHGARSETHPEENGTR